MKKPKRPLNDGFDANAGDMWDKWEAYHNWYIKTHCVRKKDLPNIEEINKIYCQNCLYEECNEICDKMRIKITYAIAKRIGKKG